MTDANRQLGLLHTFGLHGLFGRSRQPPRVSLNKRERGHAMSGGAEQHGEDDDGLELRTNGKLMLLDDQQNKQDRGQASRSEPAEESNARGVKSRPNQADRHGQHPNECQTCNSINNYTNVPRAQRRRHKDTTKDEKHQQRQ